MKQMATSEVQRWNSPESTEAETLEESFPVG